VNVTKYVSQKMSKISNLTPTDVFFQAQNVTKPVFSHGAYDAPPDPRVVWGTLLPIPFSLDAHGVLSGCLQSLGYYEEEKFLATPVVGSYGPKWSGEFLWLTGQPASASSNNSHSCFAWYSITCHILHSPPIVAGGQNKKEKTSIVC